MSAISMYGSHNAAVAIEHEGRYLVIELERFLNYKNIGLVAYLPAYHPAEVIASVLYFADKFFDTKLEFDYCAENEIGQHGPKLIGPSKAKKFVHVYHHEAHAAGTFYQSSFNEAIVISFDARGDDGSFNVFLADRAKGITRVAQIDLDLGFPYMLFGHYVNSIKKEKNLKEGNLVYPGKLMGLCSYGTPRKEWLPVFEQLYRGYPLRGGTVPNGQRRQYTAFDDQGSENLAREIGQLIDLPLPQTIDGIAAYDLVATSQQAFENVFFETVTPLINQFGKNLPLCLTGGCALNIILNTKVKERFGQPVFVAPNSSDCGIALGALLHIQKPKEPVEAMYAGLPLLDGDELSFYKTKRSHLPAPPEDVAQLIAEGKILGIARGRAEHGPRALGNRSIVCNPSIPGIKEYLHSTIKKRERYRPFAPVVRAENSSKYFTFEGESPYMAFATMVRPEWQDKLAAITHVDGSTRVQTVTKKQNPWLYEMLGYFEKYAGHGVILNTSFNMDGCPILSKISEALDVLDTTCLDAVVVEDTLFTK